MHINRDKYLTDAMGEEWAAWNIDRVLFSTWEGFGKLWEWSQQQDWWEEFTEFCEYNKQFQQKWSHQVLPDIIHPERFANIIHKFLKEREK